MRASDLVRGLSGPAGLDTQGEARERSAEWLCPSRERLRVADGELLDTLARAGARPDRLDADLRHLAVAAGLGLFTLGLATVLGVLLVHQALALPVSELPVRPGLWPAVLAMAAGLALACTCRRGSRAFPTAPCNPRLPTSAAAGGNLHVEAKR